ncbi:unnamed protein product [Eruca vesicaria subsp. sativa]|uniref:Response regulatory domain-containing protein n=1 Tax=Eruca vesicaria subsp. sativa TaxID=29727 RepID=A0ABC8KGN5_ERUVS|nr:unnamed protein product [Eruca vesicaria subsp. sativa]
MSEGSRTADGDRTLIKQRETSRLSSFLNEFPASTNVLVVEPNFVTLLKMKKLMVKYGYQVTVYADAESALAFLRNCEHEINLVIWDFHMPVINGIEALKIICTKMDLPVVIMSDDDRITSVMKATVHGACNYVMKPVRKEIIATIWQHIVRKRMMSKLDLIPPVQLNVIHNQDSFKQDKDGCLPLDQGNSEQNVNMIGENLPIQSDLVQSNGLYQDRNDSWTTSPYNGEQNINEKEGKQLKKRMAWTKDLQEKFLKAVDDLGGAKKANPKPLLKMLEDMDIKGLTRRNVCSHLQKYRLSLQGKQTTQQMQKFGCSSACTTSPLLGLNNVHTATSPLINGGASYLVQENQYQNGYMEVNNNSTASSSLMNGRATYPFQDNQYQNGYMEVNNSYAASSSLLNGRVTYPVHENQYQNGYMEMKNNQTASSSLINGRATYPVHDSQYQNGYMGVNNNQVMTNTMPCLPYYVEHDYHFKKQKLEQQQKYMLSNQLNPEKASNIDILEDLELADTMPHFPYDLDHGNYLQQQQQQQLPHQLNNVSNNEPEPASGNGVEEIYPSLQYDPNKSFFNGYNYNL